LDLRKYDNCLLATRDGIDEVYNLAADMGGMFVEDRVEGLLRQMASDYHEPWSLGAERMVLINELVDLVSRAAGKNLSKKHDLGKPLGVRGQNSDNERLKQALGWEPSIPLEVGLDVTYTWIDSESAGRLAGQFPCSQD